MPKLDYQYAVLVGIIENKVILTKRADSLKNFAGHICLPGGRYEDTDNNLTTTAIREFGEEVYFNGIINPLFCLTPEFSPTAMSNLYPVVAKLNGSICGYNQDEVQKLFYLDINDLADDLFSIHQEYPHIVHNLCFEYCDEYIWGLPQVSLREYAYLKN